MKIRFTRDVWLNADDRAKEPSFPEGSEHDMVETSAYRWVRRSVAVYVVAAPPKVKLDMPMIGGDFYKPTAASAYKPKKAKTQKAPKRDAVVKQMNVGPALPVKGSGTNGGPGWDDV